MSVLRSWWKPWRLVPALVYTALLFVAGSVPMGDAGPPGSDKLMHLGGFALMFGLYFRVVYAALERNLWRSVGWSFFATALAGALLEAWQALLPYRTADIADWAADAVGALLAAAAAVVIERVRARSAR